jgi:hypothetical protein
MLEAITPAIEAAYKAARFALWAILGSVVLTSYIIANTYFDKWWKYRETF